MNYKEHIKKWDTMLAENTFHRWMLLVCVVSILMLAYVAAEKKTRVILQPITLKNTAWIEESEADSAYYESWGHYLALLMGNIKPDRLTFIKERLEPLLAESIYNKATVLFEEQALDITNNRASFTFSPTRVKYDTYLKRVFVTGWSEVRGPISKAVRSKRTYEYEIVISDFLPEVVFMEVYEGDAKDSIYLAKEKERQEREK
jgi:conjugal transfer pilus assembly protein TraE